MDYNPICNMHIADEETAPASANIMCTIEQLDSEITFLRDTAAGSGADAILINAKAALLALSAILEVKETGNYTKATVLNEGASHV